MAIVLVVENNQGFVEDIYTALTDNFQGCVCYPLNADSDFREMQTLINKTIEWSSASAGAEKERLARELKEFISSHVLRGMKPDFAIIDVCLKTNPEGQDYIGADLRRDILAHLFPELQVMYSTDFTYKVKLSRNGNSYNVNGKDFVLEKSELGNRNSFKEILVNDFEKYSDIDRVDPRGTVIRDSPGQKKVKRSGFLLSWRNHTNDASRWILFICSCLKILSVAATFVVYLVCLGYLLWKFVSILIYGPGENAISNVLQVIEKLFIIPLPLIIVTGISIFFDQVIATRFSPDYNKFDEIEGNSKYYINLSKSLFISTLISVLAIKLIEMSFPVETMTVSTWQGFVVLGLCILVLFVFYFVIARSLHNLIKSGKHH